MAGRCIVPVIGLLLMTSGINLYGRSNDNAGQGALNEYNEIKDKAAPTLDNVREMVIAEDFEKAVSGYAYLLRKDSTDIRLNAEFAYALALSGIHDAALARLDRIWNSNSENQEVNFFAAQVFALMGYDMLAGEFGNRIKAGSIPEWIASKAPVLLEKYGDKTPGAEMSGDDVVTDFKRANRLTARNFNLMSMALFEEIILEYPGEYLPWVGYSIALEKAGLYDRSEQAVEQAISIVRDKPEQDETVRMLEQRLGDIKGRTNATGKTALPGGSSDLKPGTGGRRMLAYAGGMISTGFLSLNGRFGTFLSGVNSISADLGITSSSGATAISLGVSDYFRQKILVGGGGLNVGFGGGSVTLYLKVSAGISLMNKDKSASWDIFLDGLQPITPNGSVTMFGLSIGRSVYFGTR